MHRIFDNGGSVDARCEIFCSYVDWFHVICFSQCFVFDGFLSRETERCVLFLSAA